MQETDIFDMRSILDMDDTKYSISGAYAMQNTDILDMRWMFDMDDTKFSIFGAYAMQEMPEPIYI